MKFKAKDGAMFFVAGKLITFKKGFYDTADKAEIEALGKVKGVTKQSEPKAEAEPKAEVKKGK